MPEDSNCVSQEVNFEQRSFDFDMLKDDCLTEKKSYRKISCKFLERKNKNSFIIAKCQSYDTHINICDLLFQQFFTNV